MQEPALEEAASKAAEAAHNKEHTMGIIVALPCMALQYPGWLQLKNWSSTIQGTTAARPSSSPRVHR